MPCLYRLLTALFTAQINWAVGTFSRRPASLSGMFSCFIISSTSSLPSTALPPMPGPMTPDMTMALWNRPSASGIWPSTVTLAPPPDWPKMVTLSGSPPKLAMLSRTQRRASTRSAMPTLTEFLYFSPKADMSR